MRWQERTVFAVVDSAPRGRRARMVGFDVAEVDAFVDLGQSSPSDPASLEGCAAVERAGSVAPGPKH